MMTPGFAKSRKELFWLPYPENDRVIINAHNFTPAGPNLSVNGKSPVGVWCPSLDDAGNGTTTLNDLVGSNDGTLVNMDAATDWVSDTDAGGIRALDFDGTNDRVNFGDIAGYRYAHTDSFSVSFWVKYTKNTGNDPFITKLKNSAPFAGWSIEGESGSVRVYLINTFPSNLISKKTTATIRSGTWRHVGVSYNGSANASGVLIYIDGSLAASSVAFNNLTSTISSNAPMQICARDSDLHNAARMDDLRIFNQVLNATDFATLYASGSGRGISA